MNLPQWAQKKKPSAADPSHAFGSEQQTLEEMRRQSYSDPHKASAPGFGQKAASVFSGWKGRLSAMRASGNTASGSAYESYGYPEAGYPEEPPMEAAPPAPSAAEIFAQQTAYRPDYSYTASQQTYVPNSSYYPVPDRQDYPVYEPQADFYYSGAPYPPQEMPGADPYGAYNMPEYPSYGMDPNAAPYGYYGYDAPIPPPIRQENSAEERHNLLWAVAIAAGLGMTLLAFILACAL